MAKKIKWSKKGRSCPGCESSDAFFPIIDDLGNINENEGHCFSCGQNFYKNSDIKKTEKEIKIIPKFYIPDRLYNKLKSNQLTDIFSTELIIRYPGIEQYLQKYNVVCGSIAGSKFWKDFTGFPKVDTSGKVRSIKCFLYDKNLHTKKYKDKDGKQRKSINWLHSLKPELIDKEKVMFNDCFFGEHLIYTTDYKYIGVVESEKTAIIANYFLGNDWVFLATGSKTNINKLVYKGVNDKNVVLFPDADGFEQWQEFIEKTPNCNFIISKYCKSINNKMDIADIFLETNSGNQLIDSINAQLELLDHVERSISTGENRPVTNFELEYYDSITRSIFTTTDIIKILTENGINTRNIHCEIKKNDVIIKVDGVQVSLFEVFIMNNKTESFYKLLKIKHIPQYDHIKEFSFSFSNEEFLQDLNSFNAMYFDDLSYNIVDQKFIQNKEIINDFDLFSHIRQSINMLIKSNLNEKKVQKFLDSDKSEILDKFCKEIENKRVCDINFPTTIGVKYSGILERGNMALKGLDFDANFDKPMDKSLEYIRAKLRGLFTISDIDILQLIFFCAASIRKKFFDEYQWGKMLILNGDSGLGKDTFFPSLLSGSYVINNEQVFSDKQKAGEFTTLTPQMAKKLLYTVISDDVEASNSFSINDITNATYCINNKGVQMQVIKNSFNKIITSNFERIIFSKELDQNAIARRYINVKINYLPGNSANDYLLYFKTHGERFYPFYELFFTYCYHLASNITKLKEIENIVVQHNKGMASKLIYLNNDDNIVIEKFHERINFMLRQNDPDVYIKTIKDIKYYILNNINYTLFSPKKEYSIRKIKDVLSIYYKSIKFNKSVRNGSEVEKVDLIEVNEFHNMNEDKDNNTAEKIEINF